MAFANGVVIFTWRPLKTGKLKKGMFALIVFVAGRGWPWFVVWLVKVTVEISAAAYRSLIVAPYRAPGLWFTFFFLSLMLCGDDDSFLPQYLTQLANAKYSHSVTPEWAEMRGACILRQLGRCADHTPVLSPSRCGSKAAPAPSPRLLRWGLSGALRMIQHIPSGSIGSLVLIATSQISKGGHSPSPALGRKNGASHLRRRPRFTRTHTMTPPLTPSPCQNSCAP